MWKERGKVDGSGQERGHHLTPARRFRSTRAHVFDCVWSLLRLLRDGYRFGFDVGKRSAAAQVLVCKNPPKLLQVLTRPRGLVIVGYVSIYHTAIATHVALLALRPTHSSLRPPLRRTAVQPTRDSRMPTDNAALPTILQTAVLGESEEMPEGSVLSLIHI